MTATDRSQLNDIALSWEKFVTTARMDSHIVRPEIADSWRRCYEAGVNPYDGSCHQVLDTIELEKLLERRSFLIDIARPVMANLYKFVAGTGFIVMLSDEQGYIIEAMGDNDTLRNALKINFLKGAKWSEEEVGTNAIGTAAVLRKPMQVSSEEHYCKKHHTWTCSAAPIFDYYGKVIGILDMSGPSKETHLHTLGMVVAAVEAISDQMRIKLKNRELTSINSRLNNIFQNMSDGVMIIDKNAIVNEINPVAERILGKAAREIYGYKFADIIGQAPNTETMLATGKEYKDVEVIVETSTGPMHCLASGKPIMDDEKQVSGGVIFVEPIKHIKNLVNRFSGSHATFQFKDIIGSNKKFLENVQIAYMAADSMSSVLLEGESGTGKELFAQAIHNESSRRNAPFIAVNCGAIPRELIASELFGYVDGAFTGAKKGGRPGKFEMASGGTLFLDEIAEMPLGQQVALLRVVQEKEVTRLGGENSIAVDVRIICATNKKLQEEVNKGNFRQDLYYRLNVIQIAIPSLRQRREDIPVLFDYILQQTSQRWGLKIENVDPEIFKYLEHYDWPGNVRELQNVVERMLSITNTANISVEHLPPAVVSPAANHSSPEPESNAQVLTVSDERQKRKELLEEQERERIISLLAWHGGNISRVAQDMQLSRNTIYRKIRRYNIPV